MRTFGSKRTSNRESNPSRRSGYQRDLIRELQVHSILRAESTRIRFTNLSKGLEPVHSIALSTVSGLRRYRLFVIG
jgi:hypothetical protein